MVAFSIPAVGMSERSPVRPRSSPTRGFSFFVFGSFVLSISISQRDCGLSFFVAFLPLPTIMVGRCPSARGLGCRRGEVLVFAGC